ncbi:hypothetical protein ACFL3D_01915 [Candidatus Omnitrophota bacterium]
MTLFKVYYEETLMYEDFVEAEDEEKAAEKFISAVRDGDVENYDGHIIEFDIEKQR